MNIQDLHHSIKQVAALNSQTISTNTTTLGEIIDMQGYESLEFLLQSGTITDGAYAVSILEDDAVGMGSAVAVAAEEQLGNADFALAEDDVAKRLGYIGKKRYARLSVVSTAVTVGGAFSATGVKGSARVQPVAD